jgi:hypothetical protein
MLVRERRVLAGLRRARPDDTHRGPRESTQAQSESRPVSARALSPLEPQREGENCTPRCAASLPRETHADRGRRHRCRARRPLPRRAHREHLGRHRHRGGRAPLARSCPHPVSRDRESPAAELRTAFRCFLRLTTTRSCCRRSCAKGMSAPRDQKRKAPVWGFSRLGSNEAPRRAGPRIFRRDRVAPTSGRHDGGCSSRRARRDSSGRGTAFRRTQARS